jgi:hypothetical protein
MAVRNSASPLCLEALALEVTLETADLPVTFQTIMGVLAQAAAVAAGL